MLTHLFPGQGSQAKGMGNTLFDEFSDVTNKADKILGYSIKKLCLEDPEQQLNLTQYTQPALYTVNALTYYKKLQNGGTKPDYVAGHSLGEYNALLAADVFDFETGLQLVKKRGELMSQAKEGGMAAVIGLSIDTVRDVLKNNALTNISIANHNSHTQIVISGPKADIERAHPLFEQAGASMFIPLKVSGAFHSPYMQFAEKEFEKHLQQFTLSPPKIPVISNRMAKPYDASALRPTLAEQITHTVLWANSIEYLLALGEMNFEEVGPGTVLTGLLRRIRNKQ